MLRVLDSTQPFLICIFRNCLLLYYYVYYHSITFRSEGLGFIYENPSFYPIDGIMHGNEANDHNYHFTYEVSSYFIHNSESSTYIELGSQDDSWLFIDNRLAIDLGGLHGTFQKQKVSRLSYLILSYIILELQRYVLYFFIIYFK